MTSDHKKPATAPANHPAGKAPPPAAQASAQAAAQSSASPSPKKPAQTRGVLSSIIIFIILLGGGYYVYQQWPLPFLSSIWQGENKAEQMAVALADAKERLAALEQTSNAAAVDLTAAQNALIELRHELVLLKQNETRLQSRLAHIETEQNSNLPADAQLLLIDIKLRQSGDTEAAAQALLPLQNADGIDTYWLTGEIARLQNIPAKSKIIAVINTLRQITGKQPVTLAAAPEIKNRSDSVWGQFQSLLISLFNIERGADEATRSLAAATATQEILTRMEVLFTTNQSAAYLAALADLAAVQTDAFGAPVRNVAVHIQALQKFGAPQYYLKR